MRVQDILRTKGTKVVSVRHDASIAEASQIIAREQVGMLLVLNDRHGLIGLLSERDVTHFVGKQGTAAATAPVSAAMSEARLQATPEDSVTHVMRLMTDERLRHMPVISQEQLVGVISIGDILKSRLTEKDEEAKVLRDIARSSLAAN